MKFCKKIFLVLFVLFILLQFIRPERTNPVVEGKALEIPEHILPLLQRACFDCHSNDTKWPWYSNIMPATYFLTNHVNEGRKHLNFSEWETYSRNKKEDKLLEICEEMEEQKMPLAPYLLLHSEAKLSPEEIKKICDWTENVLSALPSHSESNEEKEEE
jgi:hypothetical protein